MSEEEIETCPCCGQEIEPSVPFDKEKFDRHVEQAIKENIRLASFRKVTAKDWIEHSKRLGANKLVFD